jgi:hypothetical protein
MNHRGCRLFGGHTRPSTPKPRIVFRARGMPWTVSLWTMWVYSWVSRTSSQLS